jgi:aryl-alcohol dehydrogenase-like predicted oxidoreductase
MRHANKTEYTTENNTKASMNFESRNPATGAMTNPQTTFAIGGHIDVRRLGFGAMRITGPGTWGPPPEPAAARALLRRAVELGVQLIDTADAYGPGVSEELIAEALSPYDGLLVATKCGYERSGPSGLSENGELTGWTPNGRPGHLRSACEASLRRLKLDRIDLYQLHTPDPTVPFAESIGALKDLQNEGKIRHIGVSSVTLEQLAVARSIADISTVQNRLDFSNSPLAGHAQRVRDARDRIHPLPPSSRLGRRWVPAGAHARGIPTRRKHRPDRPGVATRGLSRHTAHPRHRNTHTPRRQPGSCRVPPRPRRDTRDHRRRQPIVDPAESIPELLNHEEQVSKYRLLSKSGLRVSEAALGTMTFRDERDAALAGPSMMPMSVWFGHATRGRAYIFVNL